MLTGHPFSSCVMTPIGSRTTGPGSDVQRGRDALSSGCGAELKSAGHVDFSGGERRAGDWVPVSRLLGLGGAIRLPFGATTKIMGSSCCPFRCARGGSVLPPLQNLCAGSGAFSSGSGLVSFSCASSKRSCCTISRALPVARWTTRSAVFFSTNSWKASAMAFWTISCAVVWIIWFTHDAMMNTYTWIQREKERKVYLFIITDKCFMYPEYSRLFLWKDHSLYPSYVKPNSDLLGIPPTALPDITHHAVSITFHSIFPLVRLLVTSGYVVHRYPSVSYDRRREFLWCERKNSTKLHSSLDDDPNCLVNFKINTDWNMV